MKRRDVLILCLLALAGWAVAFGVAAFQDAPGYMDADYYQAIAVRFVQGHGLSEPFLWNYLDDPQGIPHPAHAYWPPLTTLWAALGMALTGQSTFQAARLGFLLLAGLLPPLTALTGLWLHGRRPLAWAAGLLAVFPLFYVPFLPTTDSFGLVMLVGTLFIWSAGSVHPRRFLVLGVLTALMTLARADGLFWLLPAGWLAWREPVQWRVKAAASLLAGFLAIMLWWYVRNLLSFGSPLTPHGYRTLLICDYNDLFAYPASGLTVKRWLACGFGNLLRDRLWALGMNLATFIGVQGGIFWWPFIVLASWRRRGDLRIQLTWLAWGLIFALMTFPFALAGARGGFFHSGAAVQPVFWALAPLGLADALAWARERLGWRSPHAWPGFMALLLTVTAAATLLLVYVRVVLPGWDGGQARYRAVEAQLPCDGPVLVANPPGYWLATGRPALALPTGGLAALDQLAGDFGAGCLLLEPDSFPAELGPLYETPADVLGWDYFVTVQEVRIYVRQTP